MKYYENRIEDAKKKLEIARNDTDVMKANIQLARAANVVNAASRNKH